jgi:hypothetical protein
VESVAGQCEKAKIVQTIHIPTGNGKKINSDHAGRLLPVFLKIFQIGMIRIKPVHMANKKNGTILA